MSNNNRPTTAERIAFWVSHPRDLAQKLRQIAGLPPANFMNPSNWAGHAGERSGRQAMSMQPNSTAQNVDFAAISESLNPEKVQALNGLPSLDEVFQKHLPSKQGHNYNPLYERHFSPVRNDVRKVLEIGVEAGTSLRFWKDYFPNAEIIGFDINERCKDHEDDRIRIIIGDQNSLTDLSAIPDGLDIVIDDGLHSQDSQISCFRYLYPKKMSQRGIYVVEDIVGGFRTIDFFLGIARLTNFWPQNLPESEWSRFDAGACFDPALKRLSDEDQYYLLNTIGVSFYRHIVFVDKGRNPEDGQAAFRLNHTDLWRNMGAVRGEWLHKSEE